MKASKRSAHPSPSVNIQEGKDVFISYSRADQDWVRSLNQRFLESRREPWIDWSGIQRCQWNPAAANQDGMGEKSMPHSPWEKG